MLEGRKNPPCYLTIRINSRNQNVYDRIYWFRKDAIEYVESMIRLARLEKTKTYDNGSGRYEVTLKDGSRFVVVEREIY